MCVGVSYVLGLGLYARDLARDLRLSLGSDLGRALGCEKKGKMWLSRTGHWRRTGVESGAGTTWRERCRGQA